MYGIVSFKTNNISTSLFDFEVCSLLGLLRNEGLEACDGGAIFGYFSGIVINTMVSISIALGKLLNRQKDFC